MGEEFEQPKFSDFSLSAGDIKFLAKRMKITCSKAKVLLEQKGDVDQIIYQISKKGVLVKEFSKLSLYPFCKFSILHYTKKNDFSFDEKNYMSDIIFNCYPKIRNEEVQIDITQKKQREIMAAYCLIILSLFDSLLDKFQESKQDIAKMFIEFISLSYNDLEKRFISDNLEEWIYTLKKMKKNISKKCKI
jgi:hypothetical protein